jgi:hypothetical protein
MKKATYYSVFYLNLSMLIGFLTWYLFFDGFLGYGLGELVFVAISFVLFLIFSGLIIFDKYLWENHFIFPVYVLILFSQLFLWFLIT